MRSVLLLFIILFISVYLEDLVKYKEGEEFLISTIVEKGSSNVKVIKLTSTTFLAAFNSLENVYFQIFTKKGSSIIKKGEVELVNADYSTGQQELTDIKLINSEKVLIVWNSYGQEYEIDIYGQFISLTGSFIGNNVVLNHLPATMMGIDGSVESFDDKFVVVYRTRLAGTSDGEDIIAQFYSHDGVKNDDYIVVSGDYKSYTRGYHFVKKLNDDNFVIVWGAENQWEDDSDWDVFAKLYTIDGEEVVTKVRSCKDDGFGNMTLNCLGLGSQQLVNDCGGILVTTVDGYFSFENGGIRIRNVTKNGGWQQLFFSVEFIDVLRSGELELRIIFNADPHVHGDYYLARTHGKYKETWPDVFNIELLGWTKTEPLHPYMIGGLTPHVRGYQPWYDWLQGEEHWLSFKWRKQRGTGNDYASIFIDGSNTDGVCYSCKRYGNLPSPDNATEWGGRRYDYSKQGIHFGPYFGLGIDYTLTGIRSKVGLGPLDGSFSVNLVMKNSQIPFGAVTLGDHKFAIIFSSEFTRTDHTSDSYAQVFNSYTGCKHGYDVLISSKNDSYHHDQNFPSVSEFNDDVFIAIYETPFLHGQFLRTSNGFRVNQPFKISSVSEVGKPSVATIDSESFVVVYERDEDGGTSLYGKLYTDIKVKLDAKKDEPDDIILFIILGSIGGVCVLMLVVLIVVVVVFLCVRFDNTSVKVESSVQQLTDGPVSKIEMEDEELKSSTIQN